MLTHTKKSTINTMITIFKDKKFVKNNFHNKNKTPVAPEALKQKQKLNNSFASGEIFFNSL